MGFSLEASFLLTAPPAFISAIIAICTSFIADRLKCRGLFVIGTSLFAIVGLAMVGWGGSPGPRYTGVFLGQIGGNALAASSLAWMTNNMRTDAKRAVATGIQVMLGGVGGVYSALVFRQQVRVFDYTRYKQAYGHNFLTAFLGRPRLSTRDHCDYGVDSPAVNNYTGYDPSAPAGQSTSRYGSPDY